MKYIYILEGKIGRFQLGVTPDDVAGLCTDNFTSCIIIVLLSKENKKSVLIHGDKSLNEEAIEQEIAWVGKDPKKIVFLRPESNSQYQSPAATMQTIMPNIKSNFEIIKVQDDHKAIVIERKPSAIDIKRGPDLPKGVEYHPDLLHLVLQHQIEGVLNSTRIESNSQRSVLKRIIYNRTKWSIYDNINISSKTQQMLNGLNITNESSAFEILQKIKIAAIDALFVLQINHAANIYSYLYISSQKKATIHDFIQYSYNRFKKLCATKGQSNQFIEQYKNVTIKDDLNTLMTKVETEKTENKDSLLSLSDELKVIKESWFMLFEKFKLTNTPTIDADETKANTGKQNYRSAIASASGLPTTTSAPSSLAAPSRIAPNSAKFQPNLVGTGQLATQFNIPAPQENKNPTAKKKKKKKKKKTTKLTPAASTSS